MYLNDAIFSKIDSSFDDIVNELRNSNNLIANVYFNNKKIFQSSVDVYEDKGYLIASIDARFAINQDDLHIENIIIEVSKGGSKDVLFSSETAACTVLSSSDYDADLYFKIINVTPNNELRCDVPESRFNTMNSNVFEKVDYKTAKNRVNNKVDMGSTETVIDPDEPTGKDDKPSTDDTGKDTETESASKSEEQDPSTKQESETGV